MRKLLFTVLLLPLFLSSATPTVKPFTWKPQKVTAFSAVQTSTNLANPGSSVVITLSATGVGNLVTVGVNIFSNSITVTSVTDDAGNSYTVSSAVDNNSSSRLYMAYARQASSATSVTINLSGSILVIGSADEYSGIASTSFFDNSSTGTGLSSTPSVSSFALSAGDLVVGYCQTIAGFPVITAGTNYTIYGSDGNGGVYLRSEYRLIGTTSETTPFNLSGSAGWADIAMGFKPPSTNNSKFFFEP